MGYKSLDGLMRHLRSNGISISGSAEKRQLRNTGYFHGYKGYRFFKTANNRLPFATYEEIYATIQYDSQLKALFYAKIMFIETSIKNIVLERIMKEGNSECIADMFNHVIESYSNSNSSLSTKEKNKIQQRKLNLQGSIQSNLSRAYAKDDPKITHFYQNLGYGEVPLWALFEIITMGDFGFLISCLTYDTRDKLSQDLGFNLASDTNRELVYRYMYTLKSLRNAIAHNSVVFDTRFSDFKPSKAMKQCLMQDIGLSYMNFNTIGDYVILMCYYLKCLKVSKREIKSFIREFENITKAYESYVNLSVSKKVIHPDQAARMNLLKNFI